MTERPDVIFSPCLGEKCPNYTPQKPCAGSMATVAILGSDTWGGYGRSNEADITFCDTSQADIDANLVGPEVGRGSIHQVTRTYWQ